MKKNTINCEQPDIEVPGLQCGHPVPCPYHTAVIDMACRPPTVTVPITSKPAQNPELLNVLKDIGRAFIKDKEEN